MPRAGGSTSTTSSWRDRRDREKFDEMLEFARALPRLRRRAARDLGTDGLSRDRVLACAVRMLDVGFFRVGGETDAEENDTYGLATLRKSHGASRATRSLFRYRAKSGKEQFQFITDPAVRRCSRRSNGAAAEGRSCSPTARAGAGATSSPTTSTSTSRGNAGEDFSAKDFRTWNATVLAAHFLGVELAGTATAQKTARKREMNAAVRWVAQLLGNTPAVCRSSYIDPRVWDRLLSGLDDRWHRRADHGRAVPGPAADSRAARASRGRPARGAAQLAGGDPREAPLDTRV